MICRTIADWSSLDWLDSSASRGPRRPPQGVDLARLADWDIVVAEDASPAEQYAAEELKDMLRRCTGQTGRFDQGQPAGLPHLCRRRAGDAGSDVGFSVDGFGAEDLRIVIRDGNIAIAGGRPRGTLYGVYVFLEDYFGVRFLTGIIRTLLAWDRGESRGP